MYLLNNTQITKSVFDTKIKYLGIENFEKQNLQHTSYYFRLVTTYVKFNKDGKVNNFEMPEDNQILIIKPNEYVIVDSVEVFSLNNKIYGTIGSLSD